jgi:hypothetical protein
MNGVLNHITSAITEHLGKFGIDTQHHGSQQTPAYVAVCSYSIVEMSGATIHLHVEPQRNYILRNDIMMYNLRVHVVLDDAFRSCLEGSETVTLGPIYSSN